MTISTETERALRHERDKAIRTADELDGRLSAAEARLKSKDAELDRLREDLARERDCVLRQQRELNKREGEFECCNCGDKQFVVFHDIKGDRTILARAH